MEHISDSAFLSSGSSHSWITIKVINALVLSLKELLLLKGIPCDASAPLLMGWVKVGHTLALGGTSCLLTVVFEIIIRDHAEQVFALYPLHMHPAAQGEC